MKGQRSASDPGLIEGRWVMLVDHEIEGPVVITQVARMGSLVALSVYDPTAPPNAPVCGFAVLNAGDPIIVI